MTLHPAYGDEDLFPLGEEYSAFCTCSTFYGHMGINCDVVSRHSATLGIYAALWTVFAIFNFCAFAWTLISFIKKSMAKGRISWNIAAVTLTMGKLLFSPSPPACSVVSRASRVALRSAHRRP